MVDPVNFSSYNTLQLFVHEQTVIKIFVFNGVWITHAYLCFKIVLKSQFVGKITCTCNWQVTGVFVIGADDPWLTFSAYILVLAHTPRPKSLYLMSSVWSKTSLNTAGVGGAGADTCKNWDFFLFSLRLRMPISNKNLMRQELRNV